jgi:peptidoglycan/xylan/chitin deacetylase (PgdA/CDA1 family)
MLRSARAWLESPVRHALGRLVGPVTHVITTQPAIALTFDDGPDAYWTPRVLELLERHGARATFFMIGEAALEHPDLVKRVAAGGHAVGNHGCTHRALPKISSQARRREIEACEEALGPFGTRLLRPPYGALSLAALFQARRLGYEVVKWNVDVGDWWRDDPNIMARELSRQMRPGSIVVLHDVLTHRGLADEIPVSKYGAHPDRTALIAALDVFLTETAGRWRCVTVPELLQCGRPRRHH